MSETYYILDIKYPEGVKDRHELNHERLVIGRSERSADLVVDDKLLSLRHCEIRFKDGRIEVEDLDSTNGTFFEEARQPRPFAVKPGESFRVGGVWLRIVSVHGMALNEARTMMTESPFQHEVDDSGGADSTMVTTLPHIPDAPRGGARGGRPPRAEEPEHPRTMVREQPNTGRRRKRPHPTKFVLLLAGIVGAAALFLPLLSIDLSSTVKKGATAPPEFVKKGLAGFRSMDGSHAAPTLIRGFLKASEAAGKLSDAVDEHGADVEKATEGLSEKDRKKARKKAKDATEGARVATRGAGTAMKIMAALMAVPFIAPIFFLLLGGIALLWRYGRLLALGTLLISLVSGAAIATLILVTVRVEPIGGAIGLWLVTASVGLGFVLSLIALIAPERPAE